MNYKLNAEPTVLVKKDDDEINDGCLFQVVRLFWRIHPIQIGWVILKSRRTTQNLKTTVFSRRVIPRVGLYGVETWTLTQDKVHKIKITQRAMERVIIAGKISLKS